MRAAGGSHPNSFFLCFITNTLNTSTHSSSFMPNSAVPICYVLSERAKRTPRTVVLPNVVPWEAGSNKFASQKGTGGFGQLRNTITTIHSRTPLTESHAVPFHICPPLKRTYASQANQPAFGSFREQLTFVREHMDEEPKMINKMLVDPKATSRVLPRWSQPNRNAKNDKIGARRPTVSQYVGGRHFTYKERLECQAALPRFECVRETAAFRDAEQNGVQACALGFHQQRQTITPVSGLNRRKQDQLDSNRYMAWLGGQLTLQSQSHTGGFQKLRDVVNKSYYDKLLNEPELREHLKTVRQKYNQPNDEEEQNFNMSNVEKTIFLSDFYKKMDNETSQVTQSCFNNFIQRDNNPIQDE